MLGAVCKLRRVQKDKEMQAGVRQMVSHIVSPVWFLWCLSSSPSLSLESRFPQQAATESALGAHFPSLLYSEVRSQQMSAFHRWLCLSHTTFKM